MKRLNRQGLLIGGAVVCLLTALFTALSGRSGSESSPPPAPSDANALVEIPAESEAPSAGSAPVSPEFYQRVRQQLLAFTPEHQEPFTPRERFVSSISSPESASHPPHHAGGMPVLPIALQPSPAGAKDFLLDASRVSERNLQEGDMRSPSPHVSVPPASGENLQKGGAPRLRGQIRNRANGKIVVLFEMNGTLIRASNEPSAEWRIVQIEPHHITVRHGEQTLVLEVPYAP